MNRLRSPHAFLAGLVGGLILDKETLLVLLFGIVLGAAGGFLVREGVAAVRWVRRRLVRDEPPAATEPPLAAFTVRQGPADERPGDYRDSRIW